MSVTDLARCTADLIWAALPIPLGILVPDVSQSMVTLVPIVFDH